jgi:hypothetical protein
MGRRLMRSSYLRLVTLYTHPFLELTLLQPCSLRIKLFLALSYREELLHSLYDASRRCNQPAPARSRRGRQQVEIDTSIAVLSVPWWTPAFDAFIYLSIYLPELHVHMFRTNCHFGTTFTRIHVFRACGRFFCCNCGCAMRVHPRGVELLVVAKLA